MTWEEPGAQGWELGWEKAEKDQVLQSGWSETGQKLPKLDYTLNDTFGDFRNIHLPALL